MRALRPSPLLWTILTAVLAFLLGYVGYRQTMDASLDRVDVIYRSLQLFVLDGNPTPDSPWQLQIAHFLAPLSVATAAVVTVATFLREQRERLLVTLFARDHVVVVGLSTSSGSIAESLRDMGQRVVVVEADAAHPRLPGLRATGTRTVIGDGRQPVILRRARVDRARHVVVTTGNDTINLDIADQIRAVRSNNTHRATVHVAVEDSALWLEVGRLTFGRNRGGTMVECFNRIDRTARHLVEAAAAGGGLSRVALVGDGPASERVAAHVRRQVGLTGRSTTIVAAPSEDVSTVIVCQEEGGLAEAIAIVRSYPGAQVAVAVESDMTDTLLELLGDLSRRLRIVPATAATLAAGFLHDSGVELMARAKHEDYLDQERRKGLSVDDNPSLLAWEELPDPLRDSNRRFAASVAETLELAGATLAPLRAETEPDLALTAGELEQLAIREHDRWASDLRKDGWTFAAGAKNAVARTHPLLVPWEELSEEEREKDRDAIRAIPRMLARAGYTISLQRPD